MSDTRKTATPPPIRPIFIRIGKMMERYTGIARATQYNMIKDGRLPRPLDHGYGFRGWMYEELEAFFKDAGRWGGDNNE